VDPLDVEAVAGVLLRLLRDADLRKEYAKKGLEQAKKYSWKRGSAKTLAVYKDIA
jgi:glycosyltransferase involved in cell wall biosynthesis